MSLNLRQVEVQKLIRDGEYRKAYNMLLSMNDRVSLSWKTRLESRYPELKRNWFQRTYRHLYFQLTVIVLCIAVIVFVIWFDRISTEVGIQDTGYYVETQISATQALEKAYDTCAGLYGTPFHSCVSDEIGN